MKWPDPTTPPQGFPSEWITNGIPVACSDAKRRSTVRHRDTTNRGLEDITAHQAQLPHGSSQMNHRQ